ncbi:50S ribosomal protein L18 [Patescibacteria group bacterium]
MTKNNAREKLKKRIRKQITGTSLRPRLSVHRSSKRIYGQLIDDASQKTILSISEKNLPKSFSGTKLEKALALGKILAKKAQKVKIKKVVFDRGWFAYHGRVKALAEGARLGGLEF